MGVVGVVVKFGLLNASAPRPADNRAQKAQPRATTTRLGRSGAGCAELRWVDYAADGTSVVAVGGRAPNGGELRKWTSVARISRSWCLVPSLPTQSLARIVPST